MTATATTPATAELVERVFANNRRELATISEVARNVAREAHISEQALRPLYDAMGTAELPEWYHPEDFTATGFARIIARENAAHEARINRVRHAAAAIARQHGPAGEQHLQRFYEAAGLQALVPAWKHTAQLAVSWIAGVRGDAATLIGVITAALKDVLGEDATVEGSVSSDETLV